MTYAPLDFSFDSVKSLIYPSAPGFKVHGTSQEAAESVREDDERVRTLVLYELRLNGPGTSDELAARIGRTPFSVRPRVSQLKAKGLVVATGERRRNISGQSASVWRAVSFFGQSDGAKP